MRACRRREGLQGRHRAPRREQQAARQEPWPLEEGRWKPPDWHSSLRLGPEGQAVTVGPQQEGTCHADGASPGPCPGRQSQDCSQPSLRPRDARLPPRAGHQGAATPSQIYKLSHATVDSHACPNLLLRLPVLFNQATLAAKRTNESSCQS